MKTEEIAELHQRYVMPTYAPELALVRGKGAYVWDAEGRRYLDFVSGIAVTSLGHCHPSLVRAIRRQAGKLMHVSNLYYNEQQPQLAQTLSERSLGGKCFFCNSGAEANETLIKLARLWGKAKGKFEVLTFRNSFHGRTLATLTATGQAKVQQGFEPLPTGFRWADFNDLQSCIDQITPETAAVLVEPIQGEGGVLPATEEFMTGLRALCNEKDILLFCDEVQTGIARTGSLFAYQEYKIMPDAISLAKGLGGGFPIGAVVAGSRLAEVFQPGHHATTFGGTPLACAAARAVLEEIEKKDLVAHAQKMGLLLEKKLWKIADKTATIQEVRGRGLLQAIVLDQPAKPFETALREKGLLVLATAGNVIRLLPPLTVKKAQIGKAARLIRKTFQEG